MNRPSFGEKKTFYCQYRSHIRVNRSLIVVYPALTKASNLLEGNYKIATAATR